MSTPMQKAVEAAQAVINKYAVTGTFITHDALTAALSALEAEGWKLMPKDRRKRCVLPEKRKRGR